MTEQSKANWKEIDVATMPTALAADYSAYKSIYAEMKAARDTFEAAMRNAFAKQIPTGKRLAIAYNFGKLSIALVDDDGKRKAASRKAVSLTDLLG